MKWCTVEWTNDGERYRCILPAGHDSPTIHQSEGSTYVGRETQDE